MVINNVRVEQKKMELKNMTEVCPSPPKDIHDRPNRTATTL